MGKAKKITRTKKPKEQENREKAYRKKRKGKRPKQKQVKELSAHQQMMIANNKYGGEAFKKTLGFLIGDSPGEVALNLVPGVAALKYGKKIYKGLRGVK